jgi:hypothetical protein
MAQCTLAAQVRHTVAGLCRACGVLAGGARGRLVALLSAVLCAIAGSASGHEAPSGSSLGTAPQVVVLRGTVFQETALQDPLLLRDAGADHQDASVDSAVAGALSQCDAGLLLCRAVEVAPPAAAAPPPAPARRLSPDGSLEDDDAPMCDRDARCIGGNIEIPELDRGHFAASPCDSLLLLLRSNTSGSDRHPARASAVVGEAPRPSLRQDDRVQKELLCAAPFAFPQGANAVLGAAPLGAGLAERSGHSPRIDRPPSA